MSEENGIVGACPACGLVNLGLRFDRKGRPYISCDVCQSKFFTRVPDGAERFLAFSVMLAEHSKEWNPMFLQHLDRVISWRRALRRPAPVRAEGAPVAVGR